MKKGLVSIASLTLIIILAIGLFGNKFGKNEGRNISIAYGEDLMKGIKGESVRLANEFPEGFLDKTRGLSIGIFKQLSKEENILYSPTPLYLALGLVVNGAEGETREEILNLLKENGMSEEELNIYYKSLIANLSQNSKDMEVDIINSIWYDKEFEVYKEYLEKNKTFYDANAYKIDFRSPKAPESMNNWVREVSRNKIDGMVEEIDDDVVMYLFSSIYFNGKWENPFKAADTREGEFFLENEETVNVEFMHKGENILNIDNDEEQGILLPYKGGKYGFLALLPNKETDINDYITKLTKDSFKDKIDNMDDGFVYLTLPKFEVEYEKSLKDNLRKLGVKKVFDRIEAELYGMGKAYENLYASEVAQKNYFKLDEEGTEAASVVKIEIKDESASIGEHIQFNRPFIYAIIDLENDLPIFIGVLNNPAK